MCTIMRKWKWLTLLFEVPWKFEIFDVPITKLNKKKTKN